MFGLKGGTKNKLKKARRGEKIMQDILKELYYGRICPLSEHLKMLMITIRWLIILVNVKRLMDILSENQEKLYQKYLKQGELNLLARAKFIQGFKLGAKFIIKS